MCLYVCLCVYVCVCECLCVHVHIFINKQVNIYGWAPEMVTKSSLSDS